MVRERDTEAIGAEAVTQPAACGMSPADRPGRRHSRTLAHLQEVDVGPEVKEGGAAPFVTLRLSARTRSFRLSTRVALQLIQDIVDRVDDDLRLIQLDVVASGRNVAVLAASRPRSEGLVHRCPVGPKDGAGLFRLVRPQRNRVLRPR